MLLFHASKLEIPKPDIHHERKKYQEQFGEVFAKQMNGKGVYTDRY